MNRTARLCTSISGSRETIEFPLASKMQVDACDRVGIRLFALINLYVAAGISQTWCFSGGETDRGGRVSKLKGYGPEQDFSGRATTVYIMRG